MASNLNTLGGGATAVAPGSPVYNNSNLRMVELENQREMMGLEARCKLRVVQATRGPNAQLVYENQVEAANQIVSHFLRGIVWVLLVAQPGAGKTGVMMEVLRLLGQHNGDLQVHTDDMLVCTGMSDRDWERTMRNGMIPSLYETVYHRGRIGKKDVRKMSNGIIVTDECHVAAEVGMTISNTLKEAGLLNIPALESKRMKMLDVSATPEGVLADLSKWESKTEIVVLQPSSNYKGFQSMIDDDRLLEAGDFDLSKEEDVCNLLGSFDARYIGQSKKYFPIRVPEKSKKSTVDARANISAVCAVLGWGDPWKHDSVDTVDDIDEKMKTAPSKHTVILIKGFWRASKRFVRTHVGGSYEARSSVRDDTTTAQGLTARFCDTFDWEGDQVNNDLRPIHYTDIKAIEEYLQWCQKGYDYKQAAYHSHRLSANGRGKVDNQVTKVHISQIEGIRAKKEMIISKDVGPQIPEVVSMTEEEFATIPTIRAREQKKSAVLAILEKKNASLAAKLKQYDCKEITVPQEINSLSYRNHIQVAVRNSIAKQICSVTISLEEREKGKIWNCFIDKHSEPKRLCFVYVGPSS